MTHLRQYIIDVSATVLQALQLIDKNKKGFLIVINESQVAIGTLTDGDIRRKLIEGRSITDNIKGIYTEHFKFLKDHDSMAEAIDLFKNEEIKFLPVLNGANKLVNIITKSQMHSLLLQDIQANLMYNFLSLDENIINYEVYQKPWGFYKTTVLNDYFQSKIISVKPRERLSLQSHYHREEHWIVTHGFGKVQLEQSMIDVKSGDSLFIPRGCKHRLINIDSSESLIVTEVQIGDYLGEDDIVRYEDDYGRA